MIIKNQGQTTFSPANNWSESDCRFIRLGSEQARCHYLFRFKYQQYCDSKRNYL